MYMALFLLLSPGMILTRWLGLHLLHVWLVGLSIGVLMGLWCFLVVDELCLVALKGVIWLISWTTYVVVLSPLHLLTLWPHVRSMSGIVRIQWLVCTAITIVVVLLIELCIVRWNISDLSDHVNGLFVEPYVLFLTICHLICLLVGNWLLQTASLEPVLVSLAVEVCIDPVIGYELVVEALLSDVADLVLVGLVNCY